MKVTSVKTTLLQFPRYERPPTFSVNPTHIFPELAPGGQGVRGGASVPDMIVVEVETDEGLRGLANTNCASLAVRTLIEAYLGPVLVGEEPTDTSRVWEKLSRLAIGLGRTGLVSIAVSLLDIALWAIKGTVAGQPVYRLLGVAVQPRLRPYAWSPVQVPGISSPTFCLTSITSAVAGPVAATNAAFWIRRQAAARR